MSSYLRSVTSRKDQFAQTPDHVVSQIAEMYNNGNMMFDPCPIAPRRCGLATRWRGDVAFVNPPFNDCATWVRKGVGEIKNGHIKRAVFLIPMRGTANWYHDLVVLNPYCHEIVFIRQGIRFINSNTGKEYYKKTPFPLCLAVFEARPRPGHSATLSSINFYENVA